MTGLKAHNNNALDIWLGKHSGKHIWQRSVAPGMRTEVKLDYWLVNGMPILVQTWTDGSWEAWIPAAPGNSVAGTLSALDQYVEGR